MKNNSQASTWLQAVACLLIIITSAESFISKLNPVGFSGLSSYTTSLGQLGVFLFFMASGYLVASLHWSDFGEGKALAFIKVRLLKILPVYYLLTLVTIVLWIIYPTGFPSIRAEPLDNLLSLIFIPSVYLKELNSLTPVISAAWILCYQMLFYLIFSIGLLLARRSGLTFIFLSIMVLVAASETLQSDNLWIQFYTNPILLYFLSGVLCFALQPGLSTPWYHSGYSLLAVSFLTTVATFFMHGIAQWVILTVSFFILTFFTFRSAAGSSASKILSVVGAASYSIFVCHYLLMAVLEKILHALLPAENGQLTLYLARLVLVVASVSIGYLIYWLIERRAAMILRVKAG